MVGLSEDGIGSTASHPGQRQRVAISRAIVRRPDGFLFDEPLLDLDSALHVEVLGGRSAPSTMIRFAGIAGQAAVLEDSVTSDLPCGPHFAGFGRRKMNS